MEWGQKEGSQARYGRIIKSMEQPRTLSGYAEGHCRREVTLSLCSVTTARNPRREACKLHLPHVEEDRDADES